ncbi:tRNA (adenosine(37)-N6)-threonylcarbamoyltransferase complex dimerization subunit type 1 TsaB [Olivibacter sitiensis]|uniref:tRNA (adenosine(37)-N6)-threonylcarbamoyltransferase complex dimerization subunit type 1 TsaB n=1 Tax=Olivibacter sitiensis TaxID=376470 RepID=UPI0003FA439B|nr:tRNA (adenosine(37)-N6)-threonylcarbamoyltransferase complex dimerization subunit type 1 TsaB [Olivibacter sitiensis]
MKILHIETATQVCSVALSDHGQLVSVKEINEVNAHASHLTLLIQDLLKDANISLRHLAAIAVSKGPGSYTGLRIGVATAKGLCYGADIPLLSVDSLSLLACGFVEYANKTGLKLSNAWLLPMIDARRMEVYSASYDSQLNQMEPISARIIDRNSFEGLLYKGKKLILFGDGADKFAPLFENDALVEVFEHFRCSAQYGVHLAYQKLLKGETEDTAYFDPFYLKDFVPTSPKKGTAINAG